MIPETRICCSVVEFGREAGRHQRSLRFQIAVGMTDQSIHPKEDAENDNVGKNSLAAKKSL
jgi:hypothetical protein